eukprot:scaffold203050_cov27-Tisochrysis_lutea.AAC.2
MAAAVAPILQKRVFILSMLRSTHPDATAHNAPTRRQAHANDKLSNTNSWLYVRRARPNFMLWELLAHTSTRHTR